MLRKWLTISALILTLIIAYLPPAAGTDEIRYLGSYWGQNNIKEDVAPGDSGVRFTVALSSDFEEDSITGIKGTLNLPTVMSSQSLTDPHRVESHFPGIVPPGGVFEMTFIMNVDESAIVGVDYDADLMLTYRVVGESLRTQTIPVKINVPGRPVLQFSLNDTLIEPGKINFLELKLMNTGTAKATDIRVFIQPPAQAVYGLLLPEQPWVIEELRPGASVNRVLGVYASQTAGESILPVTVSARYRNSIGAYVELTAPLSVHVKKASVGEANLRVYAEPLKMEPGATEPLTIVLENVGLVAVTDVRISAELSGQPVTFSGPSSWSIEALNPGEVVKIKASVASAQMAANGVYQLPLRISYKDAAGNELVKSAVITVTVGDIPPKAPNLLIESEPRITAGKTQEIKLTITNIHSSELTRVSLSAQSPNPRLTIVGSNNWLIDSLKPSEKWSVILRLYAEPELSGTSALIRVTATYIVADRGEQVSEQREVGFVVEGYIILRVYDVRVIFVGGEPYISGNILNEGISDALFATIYLNSGSETQAGSFIGEVKPNAPLPFNIRINPQDGRFRGKIVIEYKDIFRNNYSASFPVDVEIPQPAAPIRQESGPAWIAPALIAAGFSVALIMAYVYRGRRKRHESG